MPCHDTMRPRVSKLGHRTPTRLSRNALVLIYNLHFIAHSMDINISSLTTKEHVRILTGLNSNHEVKSVSFTLIKILRVFQTFTSALIDEAQLAVCSNVSLRSRVTVIESPFISSQFSSAHISQLLGVVVRN